MECIVQGVTASGELDDGTTHTEWPRDALLQGCDGRDTARGPVATVHLAPGLKGNTKHAQLSRPRAPCGRDEEREM